MISRTITFMYLTILFEFEVLLNFEYRELEKITKIPKTRIVEHIKIKPRYINWISIEIVWEKIKFGKKATKKRNTFGFNKFIKIPFLKKLKYELFNSKSPLKLFCSFEKHN